MDAHDERMLWELLQADLEAMEQEPNQDDGADASDGGAHELPPLEDVWDDWDVEGVAPPTSDTAAERALRAAQDAAYAESEARDRAALAQRAAAAAADARAAQAGALVAPLRDATNPREAASALLELLRARHPCLFSEVAADAARARAVLHRLDPTAAPGSRTADVLADLLVAAARTTQP